MEIMLIVKKQSAAIFKSVVNLFSNGYSILFIDIIYNIDLLKGK